MVHKARKCSKKCTKHLFILKPVHHLAFMSLERKYLFCSYDRNSPPMIPQFNNDRKFFTPAFIQPSNQENSKKQDDNYRIEHFRLKVEKYEQKSEMFLPKPSKKHSFCNICKKVFEDYQEHINSFKHTNLLRQSSINNEILHFCNMFENQLQAKNQAPKTCQFQKQPEKLNTHQKSSGLFKTQILHSKLGKDNTAFI